MHGTLTDHLNEALTQMEGDWAYLRKLWSEVHGSFDTVSKAKVAYLDSKVLFMSIH